METVKVTALQTHHGKYGTIAAGTKYETDKQHAAELKRQGLVSFEGEAAKEAPHEKVNISDKPKEKSEKVTTLEKAEIKPGHLPKQK